jgi:hypothetical protein
LRPGPGFHSAAVLSGGFSVFKGAIMGFQYTILPDGTIFKLSTAKDYVTAAQIIQDEVGDMGEAGEGQMVRPWISLSACDAD